MKDLTAQSMADEIGLRDAPPFDFSCCDFGFFISEVSEGICGRMLGGEGHPVELRDYYMTNIVGLVDEIPV